MRSFAIDEPRSSVGALYATLAVATNVIQFEKKKQLQLNFFKSYPRLLRESSLCKDRFYSECAPIAPTSASALFVGLAAIQPSQESSNLCSLLSFVTCVEI